MLSCVVGIVYNSIHKTNIGSLIVVIASVPVLNNNSVVRLSSARGRCEGDAAASLPLLRKVSAGALAGGIAAATPLSVYGTLPISYVRNPYVRVQGLDSNVWPCL